MELPIDIKLKTLFRYLLWGFWKNIQILARSHLSHIFALGLGVLVLIREWDALVPIVSFRHPPNRLEVLILILTVGTIGGALWEFFGNKLSMGPQETRFVAAMRVLLIELEKFTYGSVNGAKTTDQRLVDFTNSFIDTSCNAMCGKKTVHAGFMWNPDGSFLKLSNWSRESDYSENLKVPIPKTEDESTGPAGRAYQKRKVVYMPLKRWKLSWALDLAKKGRERYKSDKWYEGWQDAPDKPQKLRSVLCLPVGVHVDTEDRQLVGVLNYSTRSFDPFVNRDFMMGECFSSILAQATAAAQRQKLP
ncbi:MAG TPA: hypothetical protein DC054_09225 [Blastocatellia bacterium]|nr:hypothetical protein [Blastocatellia bacterium]